MEAVVWDADAHYNEVVAHFKWFHYGAWCDEDYGAGTYGIFLQVDDAVHVAALHHAQAVVLKHKRTVAFVDERLEESVDVECDGESVVVVELVVVAAVLVERAEHALQGESFGLLHDGWRFVGRMFQMFDV